MMRERRSSWLSVTIERGSIETFFSPYPQIPSSTFTAKAMGVSLTRSLNALSRSNGLTA